MCESDGRPVANARSRVELNHTGRYFRFSPVLNEEVDLDTTDNKTLIRLMWTTKVRIDTYVPT